MSNGVISKAKKGKKRGATSSLIMDHNSFAKSEALYKMMEAEEAQKVAELQALDTQNFDWDYDGHRHEKGSLVQPTPLSRHGMHGDLRTTPNSQNEKFRQSTGEQSPKKSSGQEQRKPVHNLNSDFDPTQSKLTEFRQKSNISAMSGRKHSRHSNDSSLTKKLMSNLTYGSCAINDGTQLIINGSETLTVKGIKGYIHNTGVGFGTGRHSAGRHGSPPRPPIVIQTDEPEKVITPPRKEVRIPGMWAAEEPLANFSNDI